MNGRRARALRRSIYGAEFSPRERRYTRVRLSQGVNGSPEETVFADDRRRAYQQAKRA